MKVLFDYDELYPYYYLTSTEDLNGNISDYEKPRLREIPDEDWERWVKYEKEMHFWQDYISDLKLANSN